MTLRHILVIAALVALPAAAQLPPPQPASGPAGTQYFHDEVATHGPFQPPEHVGDSWYDYYIFQPAAPRPAYAPVVLLSPGYGAWLPAQYRGWIEHMVKMGYTVVWARADQSLFAVWRFVSDAEAAWKDALDRLSNSSPDGLVPPALDEINQPLTAMAGHSLGGWVTLSMAARAGRGNAGYPSPKAVVAMVPGQGLMPNQDFSAIDPDTKIVMTLADQDQYFCGETIKKIWEDIPQVPTANRDVLLVQSEVRGIFDLRAGHEYPTGLFGFGAGVDNLDYHGVWKLAVGAFNCGIYGEDCAYALGDGDPLQVNTGVWSDGQPAVPLVWVEDPMQLVPKPNCSQ